MGRLHFTTGGHTDGITILLPLTDYNWNGSKYDQDTKQTYI